MQKRMGISQHVSLNCSQEVISLFVYGLIHPVIVIPSNLNETNDKNIDLTAVIAHELAHVKSNDLWWLFGFRWMKTLFWFHPLAWSIYSQHELACEETSDQTALHTVDDRESYTQCLAQMTGDLVEQKQLSYGIPMARVSQIRHRLEWLQHPMPLLNLSPKRQPLF